MKGRLMGIEIGRDAFALAAAHFRGETETVDE